MGLADTIKSFHNKFKFRVFIDGFQSGEFQKCSSLEMEVGVIKHRQGGSVVSNKSPGLVEFTPVTLERGVITSDQDMYAWFSSVVNTAAAGNGAVSTGMPEPLYKRNVDIVQYDNDGAVLRRWTLFGAWPSKFVAGEWDNTAEEKVIESITLEYDFADQIA